MERKELGKIQNVTFGEGGYGDGMIGLNLTLGDGSWGVNHFKGYWSGKKDERTKWTEADRLHFLGGLVMYIDSLLKEAKVKYLHQLKDVPVEVTFEGNVLKDFRILKEVL